MTSMQTETQSSPSAIRMLLPHLLAAVAFIGSFAVIEATGTNRTDADFYLGMIGYIATVCALMTTLAALILHPWRGGSGGDWLYLALHITGIAACLWLASAWLGAHIA